jgi:hypothetical protein
MDASRGSEAAFDGPNPLSLIAGLMMLPVRFISYPARPDWWRSQYHRHPGDVSSRLGEAIYEASSHWVTKISADA